MDDLISRQAAIDAVKEEEYPCESDYDEGYMAALDKTVWIIEKWLPSAQPEIRYYGQFEIKDPVLISEWHWIPCSERLPEGGHNIIFCDYKGNVCEGVYHAIIGQWVGFRRDAIYHHDAVTAWMPLPNPYKESETDD